MHSIFILAGLTAAVAAGTIHTVTQVEDVTITSCGPKVTDCPYKKGDSWDNWGDDDKKPKPKTTTTSVWDEWDPKKPKPTTTTVWAEWDPKKPKPKTTTSDEDWNVWTSKQPKPTSSDDWNEWEKSPKPTTTPAGDEWKVWEPTPTKDYGCPSYTATAPPEWFSYLPKDALKEMEAKWTGAPPKDWCYYSFSTPAVKTTATPYYPNPDSKDKGPAPTGAYEYKPTPVDSTVGKYTGAASANTGSFALAGLAAVAVMAIV